MTDQIKFGKSGLNVHVVLLASDQTAAVNVARMIFNGNLPPLWSDLETAVAWAKRVYPDPMRTKYSAYEIHFDSETGEPQLHRSCALF